MKALAIESNTLQREIAVTLSQTAVTSLQFHSATGGTGRTARTRRSASQQLVVRHNSNPNLRRALRVVGGGTLGGISFDLQFPSFNGIAARRDAPLILATQPIVL